MTKTGPTDPNAVLAEIVRICEEAVDSASRLEAKGAHLGCGVVLTIAIGRIQALAKKAAKS